MLIIFTFYADPEWWIISRHDIPIQVSCPVFCQTVFLIDMWVFVYWGYEPFVSYMFQPLSPILACLFTTFLAFQSYVNSLRQYIYSGKDSPKSSQ